MTVARQFLIKKGVNSISKLQLFGNILIVFLIFLVSLHTKIK